MRRNPLERVMNMLNKLSSKKMDASFILTDPDTFFGLLALHAASELGIDTGVSVGEILDFYKDGASSKPPFSPFF